MAKEEQAKIVVNCLSKRGRWRGGHKHPYGKKEYAEGHFNPQQIAAMKEDSKLQVLALTGEEDPEDKSAGNEGVGSLVAEAMKKMMTALMDATVQLAEQSPRNEDLWAGEKPKVTALQEIVGFEVSAVQRDKAWEMYQKPEKAE